ncbi:MAG: TatD family hydrolase [Phycisphaerales bacterium]|nr:TatD family hydrolase [Phycisphaerales bacterium]
MSYLAVLDAHCHIDLFAEPAEVVAGAERGRIRTIAVTNAPSVYLHTAKLVRDCQFVRAAIGLHPELVEQHESELGQLWEHLATTRYVGEVGLDFVTTDKSVRERQTRVFAAIVDRCGQLGGKILTVHSRRAVRAVLDVVGDSFPGSVILHWFSGSARELERAVEAGCYFSVNPAMIRSASGQRLVGAMPRERVLTETDGPFVSVADKPCEPIDTALVVEYLGRAWGTTGVEAKGAVERNLRALLTES